MTDETAVTELITSAYECAGACERWPAWLARLNAFLGADGARILVHDAKTEAVSILYDDQGHAGPEDPGWSDDTGDEAWGIGPSDSPHGSPARPAVYSNLAEADDAFHCAWGHFARFGDQSFSLAVLRAAERAPFDRTEKRRLGGLLLHLGRAFRLHRRVTAEMNGHAALGALLDCAPLAVILVDKLARPVFANSAAKTILARGDGLVANAGRLAAVSRADDAMLGKAIASVIDGESKGAQRVVAKRSGGRTPYVLRIADAGKEDRARGDSARRLAAIFVKDRDETGATFASELGQAFGLTPAEARLADLIAFGHGLNEASDRLGITKNTARTHMKRIYAKTETDRPAALARLLSDSVLSRG